MKKDYLLKGCFISGAFFAATGVILQALAAHLPLESLSQPHGRDFLHNAADILLLHGIALCSLSLYRGNLHPLRHTLACILMASGTFIFSLPVTLLSLKIISHAFLAPFGGSLLILSWFVMASAAIGRAPFFNGQK